MICNSYIPKTKWELICKNRDGELLWSESVNNIVTKEGCFYTARSNFKAGASIAPWYIFLFKNDYNPTFEDNYENMFINRFSEASEITSIIRPEWNIENGLDEESLTASNKDMPAVVTFSLASPITIFGAGLVSSPAFNSVSEDLNVLYAAARFSIPHQVSDGNDLEIICSTFFNIPN